jgi:dihydroneopterin aldolase
MSEDSASSALLIISYDNIRKGIDTLADKEKAEKIANDLINFLLEKYPEENWATLTVALNKAPSELTRRAYTWLKRVDEERKCAKSGSE